MLYFFVFICGLMIGSFINAIIYRLKTQEKIFPGRSHCPKCKKLINWYDNIPLLSFFLLKGRCRQCHKKISWQYPLIEFITGVIFLITSLVILFDKNILEISRTTWLSLIASLIFSTFFIIIFVYDLKYYLILDKVVLPLAILAFFYNLLNYSLINLLIGGIIGAGFFGLQYLLSQGKWVGDGDIRLGLAMGFVLGYPRVLLAILLAYVSGSVVAVSLMLFAKKKLSSKIPFGPFLVFGTYLVMLWGNFLLAKYFLL